MKNIVPTKLIRKILVRCSQVSGMDNPSWSSCTYTIGRIIEKAKVLNTDALRIGDFTMLGARVNIMHKVVNMVVIDTNTQR